MMETRQEQLSQLREFIKETDTEITLILQSLQWDRKILMQAAKSEPMVTCKYDSHHRVPVRKQKEHEEKCFLKSQGYKLDDKFLPEPLDPNAGTVVKFTSEEIKQIIDAAARNDPFFKRGNASLESQPLTSGRLTATYTTDERRAIHDAVVNTMPSFHDLSDLALPSSSTGEAETKPKSRQEVLAELRDMRRRRARHRGAAPAGSYSHTLRDLIATQMELYTGANVTIKPEPKDDYEDQRDTNDRTDTQNNDNERYSKVTQDRHTDRVHGRDNRKHYNYDRVKQERVSPDTKQRDSRIRRHRHDDRKRQERYDSSSRERDRTYDRHREREHRDRKEDKYRRDVKMEYNQYSEYDNRHKKSERYSTKDKHRHRE